MLYRVLLCMACVCFSQQSLAQNTLGIIKPKEQVSSEAAAEPSTNALNNAAQGAEMSVEGGNPSLLAPVDVTARARETHQGCKHYFKSTFQTRENIARKSACAAYFFGVGSTLLVMQKSGFDFNACLPDTLTTDQILRVFMTWIELNPQELQTFGTKAVILSLQDAFPCVEVITPPEPEASDAPPPLPETPFSDSKPSEEKSAAPAAE